MIEKEMISMEPNIFDEFDKKRLKGENATALCSKIRNDSVEDFISFINHSQISPSSSIKPSVFETNSFLLDKHPTLIEYAAFFGSIQIFNYLMLSNVKLRPILWKYAIHGKNAEIIHLLEINEVDVDDQSNMSCFEESIKCHHNEFADYFFNMYLSKDALNLNEKIISTCFKYHNYSFFPKLFNQSFIFYYLSKYKYSKVVKFYLKSKSEEIKASKIKNHLF